MDFYATEVKFLSGKNVLILMVLIFINKDVFEPSYNDFKIHGLELQLLFWQPSIWDNEYSSWR